MFLSFKEREFSHFSFEFFTLLDSFIPSNNTHTFTFTFTFTLTNTPQLIHGYSKPDGFLFERPSRIWTSHQRVLLLLFVLYLLLFLFVISNCVHIIGIESKKRTISRDVQQWLENSFTKWSFIQLLKKQYEISYIYTKHSVKKNENFTTFTFVVTIISMIITWIL